MYQVQHKTVVRVVPSYPRLLLYDTGKLRQQNEIQNAVRHDAANVFCTTPRNVVVNICGCVVPVYIYK